MPCDYSKYHPDWKKVIRPAILERDGNKCKRCGAPNHTIVCRGTWKGRPAWQNDDGQIFDAETGDQIGEDYVGEVWGRGPQRLTKIVLTVAHLDHDISNNNYENLAALCQRCHLGHDLTHHMGNARETRRKNKGLQNLF